MPNNLHNNYIDVHFYYHDLFLIETKFLQVGRHFWAGNHFRKSSDAEASSNSPLLSFHSGTLILRSNMAAQAPAITIIDQIVVSNKGERGQRAS